MWAGSAIVPPFGRVPGRSSKAQTRALLLSERSRWALRKVLGQWPPCRGDWWRRPRPVGSVLAGMPPLITAKAICSIEGILFSLCEEIINLYHECGGCDAQTSAS